MRVIVDRRGAPGTFDIVNARDYVRIHEKAAREGRDPRDINRDKRTIGFVAPLAILVVDKAHEAAAYQFALRAFRLSVAYVTRHHEEDEETIEIRATPAMVA